MYLLAVLSDTSMLLAKSGGTQAYVASEEEIEGCEDLQKAKVGVINKVPSNRACCLSHTNSSRNLMT